MKSYIVEIWFEGHCFLQQFKADDTKHAIEQAKDGLAKGELIGKVYLEVASLWR